MAAVSGTFRARTSDLLTIQQLVKRHGLRFDGNPLILGEIARVSVLADDVASFNAFNTELQAFHTSEPQIERRSWLRRFFARTDNA
jgi:hypothetical protein